MKNALEDYRLIEKRAVEMGGVFSLSDLKNLLNSDNPVLLHRRINTLIEAGVLTRFKREFYLTPESNLEILSQRIEPDSYISFGTVLARHLIIGSVPGRTVYAVTTKRSRAFESQAGNIVYLNMSPHCIFGYEYVNGNRYATAEKAFLDTLYHYQKGFIFSFNIYHDIELSLLNQTIVADMLTKYKNPKFVAFVKGVLTNGHQ